MRRIFLATMLLLISGIAHAAGPAMPPTKGQPMPANKVLPKAPPGWKAVPPTQIAIDQSTGTIRFIVNNQEVARIEADGLHVNGNVKYTGLAENTGSAGYDKPATAEPKH